MNLTTAFATALIDYREIDGEHATTQDLITATRLPEITADEIKSWETTPAATAAYLAINAATDAEIAAALAS